MSAPARPRVLFTAEAITVRVAALAREIARAPLVPNLAAPVLAGGFVMAADLLRALAREGLALETEFLWLRSYKGRKRGDGVMVLAGPSDIVRGKTVLLIDGVLDSGHTLARATELLTERGAACVLSAVAVVKKRTDAVFAADYAGFETGTEYLIGYGMDAEGYARGLPDISVVD